MFCIFDKTSRLLIAVVDIILLHVQDRVFTGDPEQLELLKHQIQLSDVDGDGEISWLEFVEAVVHT